MKLIVSLGFMVGFCMTGCWGPKGRGGDKPPPLEQQRSFLTEAQAALEGVNFAAGKPATASSALAPYLTADLAVDGNTNGDLAGGSVMHSVHELHPWWQVDLGAVRPIIDVVLWNRSDCCAERLRNFYVFVSDSPFTTTDPQELANQGTVRSVFTIGGASTTEPLLMRYSVPVNAAGRYVRVQLTENNPAYLQLAEVQVFGRRNLASGQLVTATVALDSSVAASKAIDGSVEGGVSSGSLYHSGGVANPWWEVDLGRSRVLDQVVLWNRTDCCNERLRNVHVLVSPGPFVSTELPVVLGQAGVRDFPFSGGDLPNGATARRTAVPTRIEGRYVRIQMASSDPAYLQLAEVEVHGSFGDDGSTACPPPASQCQISGTLEGAVNLALGMPARASSALSSTSGAARAVDGETDGHLANESVFHSVHELHPWWEVDLGVSRLIGQVTLWNRTDCCGERLRHFYTFVSDQPIPALDPALLATQPGVTAVFDVGGGTGVFHETFEVPINRTGRYVRVQLTENNPAYLQLAEVQVLGREFVKNPQTGVCFYGDCPPPDLAACANAIRPVPSLTGRAQEERFQLDLLSRCTGIGTPTCLLAIQARMKVDFFAAAKQLAQSTITSGRYAALLKDREDRLAALRADPVLVCEVANNDDDGDLVANRLDQCPNTPALTPVLDNGCPSTFPAGPDLSAAIARAKNISIAVDPRCQSAENLTVPVPLGAWRFPSDPRVGKAIWLSRNSGSTCPLFYQLEGVLTDGTFRSLKFAAAATIELPWITAPSGALQFNIKTTDGGDAAGWASYSVYTVKYRARVYDAGGKVSPWSEYFTPRHEDCVVGQNCGDF